MALTPEEEKALRDLKAMNIRDLPPDPFAGSEQASEGAQAPTFTETGESGSASQSGAGSLPTGDNVMNELLNEIRLLREDIQQLPQEIAAELGVGS